MRKIFGLFLVGLLIQFFAFIAIAGANSMDKLDTRQSAIVPIAAFAAKGDLENLKIALSEGLESGLTINEIKEVLVQLYAYCGFPRSLNGLNTFIAVLDERAAKGIKDVVGKDASPIPTDKNRYEYGTEIQTSLVGRPVSGRTYDFAPIIDTFLKEHLFADIFLRDVLNQQERELVTVAALASFPGVANQLRSHLNVSMNIGITEGQLRDFVKIIEVRIGTAEAETARKMLDVVLESRKTLINK